MVCTSTYFESIRDESYALGVWIQEPRVHDGIGNDQPKHDTHKSQHQDWKPKEVLHGVILDMVKRHPPRDVGEIQDALGLLLLLFLFYSSPVHIPL